MYGAIIIAIIILLIFVISFIILRLVSDIMAIMVMSKVKGFLR